MPISDLEKGMDRTHIKFVCGKELGGGMCLGGPIQPKCSSGSVSKSLAVQNESS